MQTGAAITTSHWANHLSPFLWEFAPGYGIRYYGLAYVLGFFGLLMLTGWHPALP